MKLKYTVSFKINYHLRIIRNLGKTVKFRDLIYARDFKYLVMIIVGVVFSTRVRLGGYSQLSSYKYMNQTLR